MFLPFGEYRPDVADYEGQHTKNAINVVPQGDGYGPFKALVAGTSALPAACRGMFYALKNDGTITQFAGTSTNLFQYNSATGTWTNVSVGGGPYTALATTANWSFIQFNQFVIATHVNIVVQVFDLTSSTAFANLAGSPPQAAYVTTVNRFVVLSGLASPNVYRVQWSGLNATTTWDNVTNQSNFQDLADGGLVRGVAGGEFGVVFQDRSVRRMTYAPGSPTIMQFDRLSKEDGLLAPYSLVQAGDRVFYLSSAGFKMLIPGLLPVPIGKEKIDRTFFSDYDSSNLQLIIGTGDPRATRVYFTYKSGATGSTIFDTVLAYDWVLQRWTKLSIQGEYMATLAQPGLTLEQVDAAYGTNTAKFGNVTSANPAVFTITAHGFTAGQGILISTNAPAGLSTGTPYYVLATNLAANSFEVATTGGIGAWKGVPVSTTGSTTGTSTGVFIPSIETLNIGSLDLIAAGALPQLAACNTSHVIGQFIGSALEAKIDTSEHGNGLRRVYVRGFELVTDATTAVGNLIYREREETVASVTAEQAVTQQGFIPQRQSARYARARVRIPAGTIWTYAVGVEPDIGQEGRR